MLEVTLAATLMLLVTGLNYQLVTGFLRYGGAVTARSQMQQMASVALSRLAADARASSNSALRVEPTMPVLSLPRLEGVDTTGKQVWSPEVVLYYTTGGRLIRRLAGPAGAGPDRPPALTPADLLSLVTQPGGACLADGVKAFEARWLAPILTVKLNLERASGPGRREEFRLQRDLSLRNL